MPKYTKAETDKARAMLTNPENFGLVEGETIYTNLRHVSRSGMMRVISVHIIRNGQPLDISRHVATLLGEGFDAKRWGVKVGGCGMDMGFHIVYNLGVALHGIKSEERDGGYTYHHRWL